MIVAIGPSSSRTASSPECDANRSRTAAVLTAPPSSAGSAIASPSATRSAISTIASIRTNGACNPRHLEIDQVPMSEEHRAAHQSERQRRRDRGERISDRADRPEVARHQERRVGDHRDESEYEAARDRPRAHQAVLGPQGVQVGCEGELDSVHSIAALHSAPALGLRECLRATPGIPARSRLRAPRPGTPTRSICRSRARR